MHGTDPPPSLSNVCSASSRLSRDLAVGLSKKIARRVCVRNSIYQKRAYGQGSYRARI